MRVLAGAAAVVLLAGCVGEPPVIEPEEAIPAVETASQAPESAAAPVAEVTVEEASGEGEDLDQVASRLIAENGQLRLELLEMEADRDRYRDGLAKAVEELNRVSAQQAEVNSYVPPPSRRSTPRATPRVSTLGAPQIQILGDNVIVTGRVYNNGDGDARGSVVLNLMVDGQSVDDARVPLDVPARTDQVYSYTFFNPGRNGTYSARIRLDYP